MEIINHLIVLLSPKIQNVIFYLLLVVVVEMLQLVVVLVGAMGRVNPWVDAACAQARARMFMGMRPFASTTRQAPSVIIDLSTLTNS